MSNNALFITTVLLLLVSLKRFGIVDAINFDKTCSFDDTPRETIDVRKLEERIKSVEAGLDKQTEQLDRIEKAINRFSETLRSSAPAQHSTMSTTSDSLAKELQQPIFSTEETSNEAGVVPFNEAAGRVLIRQREAFFDHFKFLSVVKADGELSALQALSIQGESHVLMGDALGKLYLSAPSGEIIMEHPIGEGIALSTISTFSIRRNKTAIIVSNKNAEVTYYSMETQKKESIPKLEVVSFTLEKKVKSEQPEQNLTKIHISRYQGVRTALFLCFQTGKVEIVRLNGTTITEKSIPSTVLGIKSDRSHTIFVHQKGVLMFQEGKQYNLNCSLPNDARLKAFEFDGERTSRGYAVNENNELLHFSILKDSQKCFVKYQQSVRFRLGEKVMLTTIKGYLLLTSNAGIGVYNVTALHKSGPREILLEGFSFIGKSFHFKIEGVQNPLISTNYKKGGLVGMHLNDGVLALFESKLPVTEPVYYDFGWMYRIILLLVIIGVVVWKTLQKKQAAKEAREKKALEYLNCD